MSSHVGLKSRSGVKSTSPVCKGPLLHLESLIVVWMLLLTRLFRSQARPRVAKVAQIAYEVAEQFNCRALKRMEPYNNTRRWRCYEAALLMKKNEIRTDEEAPLTTPVVCSRVLSCKPRGSLQNALHLLRSDRDSF